MRYFEETVAAQQKFFLHGLQVVNIDEAGYDYIIVRQSHA
jgi:hypothetical protein